MTPFIVLSPGRFVDQQGIEIAIQAFANLFHQMTPKHQKRLRLVIIEEADEVDITEKLLLVEKLKGSAGIIKRENIEQVEMAYKNASVFLFPGNIHSLKIISEAFSFGLPILSYENLEYKDVLNKTCSMLVQKRKNYLGREEFQSFLEILYFDPEVRKILVRGAFDKYENELNWGGRTNNLVKVT